MKSLLVPTDFSDCAGHAVDMAIDMARVQRAELHFLHIIDIPADWVSLVGTTETSLYADITNRVKKHQQALDQLVAKAEKVGLAAQKHIIYNKSYQGIIDYADNHDIDLVVMGSHGASGFREWLMGSNAQHVVRDSKVPVLVVKKTNKLPDIQKLLVYGDFDPEQLDAFVPVVKLAKDLQAKIDLLLLCTPSNFYDTPEAKARLDLYESAAPALIEGKYIYNASNQEEGLARYLEEEENTGLLTMLYNRRKSKLHYGRKQVEELINHLNTPVLSIPAN